MNSDAGFADVENDLTVVGANIQVGEGFDLLTSADAPVPAVEPAASLCRHWCHGEMPCGWGFRNLDYLRDA